MFSVCCRRSPVSARLRRYSASWNARWCSRIFGNRLHLGHGALTFGDPDFFNGVGHAMPLVNTLHRNS